MASCSLAAVWSMCRAGEITALPRPEQEARTVWYAFLYHTVCQVGRHIHFHEQNTIGAVVCMLNTGLNSHH